MLTVGLELPRSERARAGFDATSYYLGVMRLRVSCVCSCGDVTSYERMRLNASAM